MAEVTTNPTVPNEEQVDYKALYEQEQAKNAKLATDNANLTKYNGDLKAKYQSKLTDEEKTKQEREAEIARYKEMERLYKTNEMKSRLSKTVSDENLVAEVSELFVNGDIESGIDKINVFLANERANNEKKLSEAKLTTNPTPPPSTRTDTGVTKAQFDKMSYAERVEFKKNNVELYEKYTT